MSTDTPARATPKAGTPSHGEVIYAGCLAADQFWAIPIAAQEQFRVEASKSASCDARGWTWNDGRDWVGPEGHKEEHADSALSIANPIAQLIGAIKSINPPDVLDENTARSIFQDALSIGEGREGHALSNGFLYLIMNDDWTYRSDRGSVSVKVTVSRKVE